MRKHCAILENMYNTRNLQFSQEDLSASADPALQIYALFLALWPVRKRE